MDLGNMEDPDARVKHLEKTLHSVETRAHEANSRAELLREQLERLQHDNRSLTTEQERATTAERELRLEIAQYNSCREADRHKIRNTESKLIAAEADARLARLKSDTLESTLASAEAEAKWLAGELDRRSIESREKLRESSSKTSQLEVQLDQALAERESYKRETTSTRSAYQASQKQLEQTQSRARELQSELEQSYMGGAEMSFANTSNNRLEHGLAALQAQIEASQLQEARLQDRFTEISRAYNESCDRIEQQTKELQAAKETNAGLVKQISELETENEISKNTAGRVARQIQHLLINVQLAADSQPLLTPEEKLELSKALAAPIKTGAAMEVVYDRLGYFTDVAELLAQNENLLKVLESLTAKCERYEAQESVESDVVTQAKETITTLNTMVQDLQKERDVLRAQISAGPRDENRKSLDNSSTQQQQQHNTSVDDRVAVLKIDLDLAKSNAQRLEAQLSKGMEFSANATQRAAILTSDLAESREIAEQLRAEKSRIEAQYKLVQGQFDDQQNEIKELAAQRNAINLDYNDLRENFNAKDRSFEATQKTLVDQINFLRSEVSSVRHELSESEGLLRSYSSQRELAEKTSNNLKLELLQAKISYDSQEQKLRAIEKELKQSEERLHLRTLSFTTADSDKANKLEEQLAQAEKQIQDLRTLAADTQKEMDSKQAVFDSESKLLKSQLSAAQEAQSKADKELEALKNTPPDTTELDASRNEAVALRSEVARIRTEAANAAQKAESQLESTKATHAASISDLESINETCKSKIATLETQVQTLSESLASEKQVAQDQIAALTRQYEALDASLLAVRDENAQLSANKESLLQQLRASVNPADTTTTTTANADHDADMDTSMSLESRDPIIDMLKRDKQSLEYLYQNAIAKTTELESETKSLRAALEKAETDLSNDTQVTVTDQPTSSIDASLQETNAALLIQIQECTVQREQLTAELDELRTSVTPLQEELRALQEAKSVLQEELSLAKADRDTWKNRVGASDDEKIASIEAQLAEKDALLDRVKQEASAKLEQEVQKSRLAMNEVGQLNLRIQELSKGSETKITDEISKKNQRISYLENEINRISDELTEEEQKKKALGAEADEAKSKIAGLEEAVKNAQSQAAAAAAEVASSEAASSEASSAATKEAEERIKKLESELAAANANATSLSELSGGLDAASSASQADACSESQELESLVQVLSSKSSAEEVAKFRELVATVTKDRIKGKTASIIQQRVKAVNDEKAAITKERDDLSAKLTELKSNVEDVEKNVQKRMELKLKILQAKADKTQQTNEELKLTIRKLKGGDTNVNILTLPDGTTKAVPSGTSTPQDGSAQVKHQAHPGSQVPQPQQQQRQQAQKRPQIQRNGTKHQNKRNNNGGDDNDLNKRLREN